MIPMILCLAGGGAIVGCMVIERVLAAVETLSDKRRVKQTLI